MATPEVEAFLTHVAVERKVSASTAEPLHRVVRLVSVERHPFRDWIGQLKSGFSLDTQPQGGTCGRRNVSVLLPPCEGGN
jgi:hypothetical protein